MKALCLFLATVLIALSCGVGCNEFVSEETPTDEESIPEHIVIDFEEQFDIAVREKGDKYVAARDAILKMGKDVIPLLEEKRSEDNEWEERFTAYVILAYFEHEKEYAEKIEWIDNIVKHSKLRNPAAERDLQCSVVEEPRWIPLAVESLFKNRRQGYLVYFGGNISGGVLGSVARKYKDQIIDFAEYKDEALLKKPMEEMALTVSSIPVSMKALDILYRFGGEEWVIPVIREGLKKLKNNEVDIRKSMAIWMRNLKWSNFTERRPSEEAVELLLEAIRSDTDSDVRTYALKSLAAYKDPTVLPDLREILEGMKGTRWEQTIPFRVLTHLISDLESLADTERDEETSSLTDIKESESPGHPWMMTSDGEKVILFSTGLIRPSPAEREIPRSEFYHGSDAKKEREFELRKVRETKGLKGKDLKELRKFRGKRHAVVVKSEINASVEEWDKIPDELEWSGDLPAFYGLFPHIPRISIAFLSDAVVYAGKAHGDGTFYVELKEVKKNGTFTELLFFRRVKMDVPEEYSMVEAGADTFEDLVEPNLFLFGGELWICLTVRAKRAPGGRAVCVAKTKDVEGDATITPWRTLKGYFVCPGAQPRIAITKEGIFCVAKMLEKGSNKEEKTGTLSVYFSKDGKKWEHLKGKMPEIRCGDYDVTVSPDGAIYLFACAVRDKPDGEEDSEMQFEKTPKLYKTKNVEEGWEEISLSQFEKVDVTSNFQACFHKGKLVIAAETTNSKIAFAVIGNEVIKEAKGGVDNGGKNAKKDAIDFTEVDRLIVKLSRGRGRIRKKAIDELISVGKTSLSHAKQLVSYLNEHSQKESSPKIKATLAEVIEELSEVPVIRPSVRFVQVERSFFLLDNRSDLLDLVRSADGISEEAIDFGKSLALGCFAGFKPCAPSKVEILRIRIDFAKSSINVFFKDTPPVGGVFPAVTYPADIALIPRDESFSVVTVIDSDTGKQLAIFYPYSGKDVAGKSDKKLVEALKDENTFIARAAALELGKSKNKEFALKTLKEFALDVDQNVWVRKAAIKALGTIDDKAAVPALSEFCRTIRTRNRQDGKDSWQRRALHKAAITALADYPGLESLSFLLNEFRIGPIFGGIEVLKALKKRQGEIEKIVKDPESIKADSKVKNRAMRVYINFYGSKAFPVFIDYARKSGSEWAYAIVKKSIPGDMKEKKPEEILQLAEKWYRENAPYIVGSTSRFYVDTDAKAAGVPVEIWRKIDSEKRGDWNKLTDEEKEKAIEVAKERLKKPEQR